MMVPSEDGGDVLVRRHSLTNPPASQKKIVHAFPPHLRQPALCSASPDSLYCAGQPVLLAQPVHQRCVPSLMVVKMMTRKLFHLPQRYYVICCYLLLLNVVTVYFCIFILLYMFNFPPSLHSLPDQPTHNLTCGDPSSNTP